CRWPRTSTSIRIILPPFYKRSPEQVSNESRNSADLFFFPARRHTCFRQNQQRKMPPCYSMNNAEKGESRAPCSAAAPESRAERIQLNARARKRRCVFCKCAQ